MPTSFSAGTVFGRSVSILLSNAGAFVLLVMLVQAPLLVHSIYESTLPPIVPGKLPPRLVVSMVGGLFAQSLSSAAVTYGVLQHLRGKEATLSQCLRFGLSRIVTVLGVGVVTTLATVLGALACIGPGIFAACVLFVAVPVAVVEGGGVGDALRRSAELTRGARFPLLRLLLVLLCVTLGLFLLVALFTFDPRAVETGGTPASHVATSFISVPIHALQAVVTAVAYHDLRVERERVRTEDIASAFD